MYGVLVHNIRPDCESITRRIAARDEYERLSARLELSLLPSGKQIVSDLLRSLIDLRSDFLPSCGGLFVRTQQESKTISHQVAHPCDLFDKPVILCESEAFGLLSGCNLTAPTVRVCTPN